MSWLDPMHFYHVQILLIFDSLVSLFSTSSTKQVRAAVESIVTVDVCWINYVDIGFEQCHPKTVCISNL